MTLMHLALLGAALIAVGVVLVCAAHIPGLRALVGAEPTGPVPDPEADADLCALLRALDLTDGPTWPDGRAER